MDWSNIPDLDTSTVTSEDNPFASPKTQAPEKVSVQMPTNDWLCSKLSRFSISLVEGYPSCISEASDSRNSFSNQRSGRPSGMGCIPTGKLTPMLCPCGVLVHLISRAVIEESRDRLDYLQPHLHRTISLKRHCECEKQLEKQR